MVVLDVNVVISAILAPRGVTRQILSAWEAQRFLLLISEGIIAQIEEKLRHPKIGGGYGVSEEDIVWVRSLLLTQSQVVLIKPQDIISVTGDPEDDYVLATTRLGKAEYLVTGDRGLLTLDEYAGAKIITPRQLLDSLPGKAEN
ncbi:MAG: putative toxin-antitoxin system toxin component, PIN family [Chloroflexi bacterium]|nr:putative toxin-antitoxin system toxin component, PIN family [Chloroflexota bacterium]